MKFEDVLSDLDEYTKAPEDGDYDGHTRAAMEAVYNYVCTHFEEYAANAMGFKRGSAEKLTDE